MKKKVKLKGYFSGNLGDDLFIEIISNRYQNTVFYVCGKKRYKKLYSSFANVLFISYDTFFRRAYIALGRFFQVLLQRKLLGDHTFSPPSTDETLEERLSRKADVNVMITGSLFINDADEDRSKIERKKDMETKYYGRHPYLLGCNFGPFVYPEYLRIYQELFKNAADVCFRDSYSASLFEPASNIRHETDIVFSYPLPITEEKKSLCFKNQPYWLISVANLKKEYQPAAYYNEYINMLCRIISERAEKHELTLLAGFSEEQKDNETIQEIMRHIEPANCVFHVCYPSISSDEMLGYFQAADAVIATRFHAMVLGLCCKKRTCAICYNEKVRHVLEDIDPDAPYLDLSEINTILCEMDLENRMYTITQEKLDSLRKSANRQFQALDQVLQ